MKLQLSCSLRGGTHIASVRSCIHTSAHCRRMHHISRKKWRSAITALTEGGTNTRRQRRGEKWKKKRRRRRKWRGWRRRPEWQRPGPTEQARIIRAGKWAESHAVLANRPGATDDKPDGWQCTVSTLLWERGRTVERESRELQVVREVARFQEREEKRENKGAGGQSGNVFVNEHWEQMFTPGTWVTCSRWSYTNISGRQSCFGNSGDLIGRVKPQQQLQTSESNYFRARKWQQKNGHKKRLQLQMRLLQKRYTSTAATGHCSRFWNGVNRAEH